MKTLYVYILECSDGTYYTGVTNDPDRRLLQHNAGINPGSYTCSRRPVKIVYCQDFQYPNEAINWEKRIKRWSHKKKQALINDDFDKLIKLSKKNFKKNSD